MRSKHQTKDDKPKGRKSSKRKTTNSKPPTCYKCEKIGHKSPECMTKKKINQLVKDEGLKRQLLVVFIDSDEEEFSSSGLSLISSCSNSENSEVSCDELEDCQCNEGDACLCALNGLSINVLTKEDSLILDLIDQVEDSAKKRQMIEKYITHAKSKKKSSEEDERFDPGQYSLQKIFDKVNERHKEPTLKELQGLLTNLQANSDAREVDISDLKKEIKQIKKDIRWLKSKDDKGKGKMEDVNSSIIDEDEREDCGDAVFEFATQDQRIIQSEFSSKGLSEFSSKGLKINMIDRIITQKWYVKIYILIDDEFSVTTEALIDSGADLNCLAECLVPSKYYSKTAQMLSTTDGTHLNIDYKLSNAVVCNNGVCFETPFLLVKNMAQAAILGYIEIKASNSSILRKT